MIYRLILPLFLALLYPVNTQLHRFLRNRIMYDTENRMKEEWPDIEESTAEYLNKSEEIEKEHPFYSFAYAYGRTGIAFPTLLVSFGGVCWFVVSLVMVLVDLIKPLVEKIL